MFLILITDRIIKKFNVLRLLSMPRSCELLEVGEVLLTVGDPNTPKSNSFTMSLGESDLEFDARLSIESLKVIPDSYTVTIGTKPVMMFQRR